jgi:NhaP-type Na+/H+ or K+/H+ antiporter
MYEHTVIVFAAILSASIFCQWLAWRIKLPAIIFLLAAGVLAGPVLGVLHPDRLLGELLFPFVSLAVAVILFEGSLTLKFRQILNLQAVVRNMLTFGLLVTWVITAVTTRLVLGLDWELCFLFGAITVVTGPTVIVPMLRTVRPSATVANILRWEGIVIDPIGAALALLVYEFIIAGGTGEALGRTILTFARINSSGLMLGALCGYLFGLVMRRHWLPEFLHNVTALGLVFAVFALANHFQPESGLMAVTIMGIWLANMKDVDMEDILDFKESLSILLISFLFIILAARLDLSNFLELGWSALLIFLAIQFLARPLNVMVSALGSPLTWPERHLLAWIAPRGIVAAAISSLFALKLEQAGYAEARLLVPLTFLVIIGTVLLQSATSRLIARMLGVAEPEPRGFLIIGANIVARAVGEALARNGYRVILADTVMGKIEKANEEGLSTYFGNPMSEHAERHLDLVGIGRLLALYPHESLNIAAIMHYRLEFGTENIFYLPTRPAGHVPANLQVTARRRGRTLFGPDITYATLASTLNQNGRITTVKLTAEFTFADFLARYDSGAVPLFAIDPRDRIHLFTLEAQVTPGPGWTLVSLVPDRGDPNATGRFPAAPEQDAEAES